MHILKFAVKGAHVYTGFPGLRGMAHDIPAEQA